MLVAGEAPARLGPLIESAGVIPSLSGFQNVMIRAIALGASDPKASAAKALASVGLEEAGKKAARKYSLGMTQRLGIALALVGSPDVLLLDEPFNGLDPEGVRRIRALLTRTAQEHGCSVLISSHVLDQLDRMVERWGVIREGKLVCEIASEEVRAQCTDYLCVKSPQPARALAVLQRELPALRCTMMPDDSIRLLDPVGSEEVGRLLLEANVPVSGLFVHACDIEDFFIGLMGGEAPVRVERDEMTMEA